MHDVGGSPALRLRLLRMHATEAESEGLATFGGGIGSMLPMQPYIDRVLICCGNS